MKYNDNNMNEDYIRPVEEYRDDCNNYHSHEQTYDNYNSEQSSYDAQEDAEKIFSYSLMPGENILWCGRTSKKATLSERGIAPVVLIFPCFWTGFAVFWTALASIGGGIMGVFGIPFIFIGIMLFYNIIKKKNSCYAITNIRVLYHDGKTLMTRGIDTIRNIEVTCSSRNIGCVSFSMIPETMIMLGRMGRNTNYRGNRSLMTEFTGIIGVNDPHYAAKVLNNAVYSYRQHRTKTV